MCVCVQDSRHGVWRGLQGLCVRLGQSHSHGETSCSAHCTVMEENECVCNDPMVSLGGWIDPVSGRCVFGQERYGRGWALHRGSAREAITGEGNVPIHRSRGHQTSGQGRREEELYLYDFIHVTILEE